MTTRPYFNRTRNSTMFPFFGNGNISNDSNFGSDQHNNNNQSDPNSFDDSPGIIFYLLIALVIPSIICSLFLFYNFIRLPQLRNKSSNILIICLLIVNFIHLLTDLPFRVYFLSENEILIKYPVFCLIWTCYDNILTTTDLFVMAFTSVERYLSIFHHIFLRYHKRFLYLPPVLLCFTIPTIWYTGLIFGYPCRQSFTYNTFQCGTLCYLTVSSVFVRFEDFVFFMFPLFVIVVGNSALIIAVLIQKASLKRQRRLGLWRNNLRMISQLMFIAILYMSVYVPSYILLIFGSYIRRNRFQPWAASVRTRYFTHLKYLIIFGCPFVVLAGQREMHQMIKNGFYRTQQLWCIRWKSQISPIARMDTRNCKDHTK